jgi:hypothetical protein
VAPATPCVLLQPNLEHLWLEMWNSYLIAIESPYGAKENKWDTQ